jgi:hypothetical protein
MSKIKLFDNQKEAIKKLKSGSILCGGVGSGKSLTALAYFFEEECWGYIDPVDDTIETPMIAPKDLYIITTARKRDTLDWEKECTNFMISTNREYSINNIKVTVDSWNNISKYVAVKDAFFIFDEQRVVGSGTWVKSFIKITKANRWILLSATPGDTWMDYIPVFIANGFYKNRSEFLRTHVIFNSFVKYPKVDRYVNTGRLAEIQKKILVIMDYEKKTKSVTRIIPVVYDKAMYEFVGKKRWNVFTNLPIANISELCFVWRKITNADPSRVEALKKIIEDKKKVIVFYNFNYELDILREVSKELNIAVGEWNGHKHEMIPKADSWLYLVQYTSGAEGWNCVETDTVVFYSQNYSYKIMHQAAGRIDRLNTPFLVLYYYHFRSTSNIDLAIEHAIKNKKMFNERDLTDF